jgi:hypothetical protein
LTVKVMGLCCSCLLTPLSRVLLTVKARHEIGGIAPHNVTTSALDRDERLVSRPGYFTPEETVNRYPLTGAVGGFQCRSGRFGEDKTLSSPYENQLTYSGPVTYKLNSFQGAGRNSSWS